MSFFFFHICAQKVISSFIIEVLINIFFFSFEKIVEICSCFGYEYSQVTHGKCIGIFGLDIIIHCFVYEKVVFPLLYASLIKRENTQSVDLSCLQYYVTHATIICELSSCLGILYDGIPCVRTFHWTSLRINCPISMLKPLLVIVDQFSKFGVLHIIKRVKILLKLI